MSFEDTAASFFDADDGEDRFISALVVMKVGSG
jgi:hypothetical protein